MSERGPDGEADDAGAPRDQAAGEQPAGTGEPFPRAAPDSRSVLGDDPSDGTYVESQVIMSTVRVITPFAFTYGLFLTFHGGASPGGGFQGGAIVGTTVLMIAFAFGIEPTRDWLANTVVVGLAAAGVAAFALLGLLPIVGGGRFLEHAVFATEFDVPHGKKYALEGVEIAAIMPIVAAIVIGLFFAIAAGFVGAGSPAGTASEPSAESGDDATAAGGDAE